ncbi:MAG: LysE family transporter, partial [Euryarchaeota archaeon]|nr:LysE family transporter [Euryarchaeota archaeon]
MLQILQNIILGISLAAPIGPANIAVIKRGLKYGSLSAFFVGVGVVSADTTYLLLIYFGLSNFVDMHLVKIIIWFFGALVLIYLGYSSVKEYFEKINLEDSKTKIEGNSFIIGYMVNISNPMTIVWWVGVFGSVLSRSIQHVSQTMALLNSLTILIGVLSWHSLVAASCHWGRKLIRESMMKYISLVFGVVLIGFGC